MRADSRPALPKTKWSANAPWFRDSRAALQEATAKRGHTGAQGARQLALGFRQFAMTAEDGHVARTVGCAAAARIGQAAFSVRQTDQVHAVMQEWNHHGQQRRVLTPVQSLGGGEHA